MIDTNRQRFARDSDYETGSALCREGADEIEWLRAALNQIADGFHGGETAAIMLQETAREAFAKSDLVGLLRYHFKTRCGDAHSTCDEAADVIQWLEQENAILCAVIRTNALRFGHSHAEIDAIIDESREEYSKAVKHAWETEGVNSGKDDQGLREGKPGGSDQIGPASSCS